MICHFRHNQLYRIDVNGNGQTVYYARDKDNLIGVNVAQSSDLVITVKDNNPDIIRFITKPSATLYPIGLAPKEELILKDFKWNESLRPVNRIRYFQKELIFILIEEEVIFAGIIRPQVFNAFINFPFIFNFL